VAKEANEQIAEGDGAKEIRDRDGEKPGFHDGRTLEFTKCQ
jgi:hypothetical protein